MEDNIEKMNPSYILKTVSVLEDENHKKRYIIEVLRSMRDNKYDIRKFRFDQIATLIDLVGLY